MKIEARYLNRKVADNGCGSFIGSVITTLEGPADLVRGLDAIISAYLTAAGHVLK